MSATVSKRPANTEYLPYHEKYISLVQGEDLVSILKLQLPRTLELLRSIPEQQGNYSYAQEKWTIKELIGHMIDTERILAYRALRIARNDKTPIEGFEQDDYVKYSLFNTVPLENLCQEFEYVRQANIYFFEQLNEEAWKRMGIANKTEVSVRALGYIIAGHALHHVNILTTRYLASNNVMSE